MDFLGLSWATPLILFGIYGTIRYFSKSHRDQPDKINWGPIESVAITFTIYITGQIIGALLVYLAPLLIGWDQKQISDWIDKNAYAQFLLILCIETATFLLIKYFLKQRSSSFGAIGLVRPKLTDIGYVLLAYLAYFVIYLFLLGVVKQALPQIDTEQPQAIGFEGARGLSLVFVFLSLVILPPLIEEILMRGFLYSGLKKGLGLTRAAFITSVVFAIAHLQFGSGAPLLWTAAIDTFLLSLILIYLREKTGGLAAPVGLHALKNLVAFLSIFVFHLV